jgi:hypothetical protein
MITLTVKCCICNNEFECTVAYKCHISKRHYCSKQCKTEYLSSIRNSRYKKYPISSIIPCKFCKEDIPVIIKKHSDETKNYFCNHTCRSAYYDALRLCNKSQIQQKAKSTVFTNNLVKPFKKRYPYTEVRPCGYCGTDIHVLIAKHSDKYKKTYCPNTNHRYLKLCELRGFTKPIETETAMSRRDRKQLQGQTKSLNSITEVRSITEETYESLLRKSKLSTYQREDV